MIKRLTTRLMNRNEKAKVLMSVATLASPLVIEIKAVIRKKTAAQD
jgi:hypothetical protein